MASTPALGSLIGGKYRIVRPLGAGGMGAVYEAEHVLTGKRAAIKWLHPRFAGEEDLKRAIHEARAASRIRHENVVDVYDVVQEDASIFLVMELLTGEPLSARLAREALPPHALIALLLPAMRGMVAVHTAGVVHRDVKPHNIFLAEEPGHAAPIAKIIDFGVSKVLDPEAALATRSGVTIGTPKYMSYEQLLGAHDIDARTDIYAFGVILYEALAGVAPYGEARSLGDLGVRFTTISPSPPHVLRPALPESLSALVMHAIARDRDQRLSSMEELVRRLEPFASEGALTESSETDSARRPRPAMRALPRGARRRAVVLSALLALAAVLAVLTLLRPHAPPPRASLPPRADERRGAPIEAAATPTPHDLSTRRAGTWPPDASGTSDGAAPGSPSFGLDSPPPPRRRAARAFAPAAPSVPPATPIAPPLQYTDAAPRPHANEVHRAGELRREEF